MGRSPTTVTPFDGGSPSKYSVHGSAYNSSRGRSWLERATSGHSRQPDIRGVGEKAFLWPPQSFSAQTRDNEDDPFLVPPSRCASTRTAATKMSFRSAKEEEILPYDASAQKRYRHGLLERLKLGTMSRGQRPPALSPDREEYEEVRLTKGAVSTYTPSGISPITRSGTRTTQYSRRRERHRRSDSDVSIGEVRRPERTYSPAASSSKERGAVKAIEDGTEWVAGRGFRLVEEDASCGPPSVQSSHLPAQEMRGGKFRDRITRGPHFRKRASLFAIQGAGQRMAVWSRLVGCILSSQSVDIDKYTVLPVHKTVTKIKDGPNTPILPKYVQSSKVETFPSISRWFYCSPAQSAAHHFPRL
jgi:hypothetical protein